MGKLGSGSPAPVTQRYAIACIPGVWRPLSPGRLRRLNWHVACSVSMYMWRSEGTADLLDENAGRGAVDGGVPDEFDRLAHDLRSPLAVVLSYAEVLPEADEAERVRLCERLVANTRRALEVLEEFGLLRDLRAGGVELEAAMEDGAAIVGAAATAVAAQAVSGAERMDFACEGSFFLACDRLKLLTALRGVLRHLLRRVATASPLRLRMSRAGGWVNLELRLDGLDGRAGIDWGAAEMELLQRTAALHGGRVIVPGDTDCPTLRLSLPAAARFA